MQLNLPDLIRQHPMLAGAGVVGLSILAASAARRFVSPRVRGWALRTVREVARRRPLAIAASVALVLLGRLVLLPVFGIPDPTAPDEFSYLLMADTFASGRLTNSPHPLWPHFETMFVLQQPTYASVYPVAQGLSLALGIKLFGHPWFGVWLSTGALCGAICWMLQGWMPAKWALLGSVIAVLRIGIHSYWMDSYWGGSHAALGGALVFGALPRLRRGVNTRDVIALGLGLCILANSRPYEGLLLFIAGAVYLKSAQLWSLRFWAPLVLIGGLSSAFFFYYCWRVTGKPWKLPQQAYMEQYSASTMFVWQSPREPEYRHRDLREAHLALRTEAQEYASLSGAARAIWQRLTSIGGFFLGPLIVLPLLLFVYPGQRKTRVLLLTVSLVLLGISFVAYAQIHYAAPIAALLYALAMQPLRRLTVSRRRGNRAAVWIVPAIPLIVATYSLLSLVVTNHEAPENSRAGFERRFLEQGGRHLIFVRYPPGHTAGNEWVYNRADIDRAPIVWARDMGEKNAELLTYYPGRKFLMVTPASSHGTLRAIR